MNVLFWDIHFMVFSQTFILNFKTQTINFTFSFFQIKSNQIKSFIIFLQFDFNFPF